MILFIRFQQQKYVRRWELNNYKTHLLLNDNIKNELTNFVINNFNNQLFFRHNGNARRFCILNQISTPITNLLINYRKQVYNDFGVSSFEEEPIFGIFLGVNTETGFVHEHTDPTKYGFYHTRINFLVSKPIEGGIPVINNEEFIIDEGESWINLASEWKHKSTPVVGEKPRIVLSLGALVQKTQLDPILRGMGIE